MESVFETDQVVVLSDEELEQVVGGADLKKFNAQETVYRAIGMCGCGLQH